METYAADGFDAFEECLAQELPDDSELTAALKAGLDAVYKATQANIERNFGRFAEHCATDVFAVPDELTQANDLAENLPSCSVEEEKALDDELRQLRRRLTHHVAMKSHCEAQCTKLEAEMADHADVAAALKDGKENSSFFAGLPGRKNEAEQAAAAIVAAARQLQPLLEQAEEMQRRGILIQDGDASSTDPVVVAKATLRRHFVQGSSLEVLKSINQRLNAQKAATAMAETAVA